ncbi:MAG: mechanosensitive ion channel family protein [Lewinellaceae bacterium]|nr:mechanosensitive ion channel family protein [Lewinellaceae bacterium]
MAGVIEQMLLGRPRRKSAGTNEASWKTWRGLGWLSGAWICLWFTLQVYLVDLEMAATCRVVFGRLQGCHWYHLPHRILGRLVLDNTSEIAGVLPTVSLMHYVLRVTIYIIGSLIILALFDISITPMLTALGVGGLAVALALQDTLSNLFAGIQIIASRKLQPGQYITLEGLQEGYITDITWRNTTIQTLRNTLVIVPNKTIASSIITNTWLPDSEISVLVECSVHYKSNLEEVERLVIAAAQQLQIDHEGAVSSHEPAVRFYAFGPSSIDFRVGLRAINYEWQYALRSEMIKRLHKLFQEEGIVIPYPIRTLEMDADMLQDIRRSNEQ